MTFLSELGDTVVFVLAVVAGASVVLLFARVVAAWGFARFGSQTARIVYRHLKRPVSFALLLVIFTAVRGTSVIPELDFAAVDRGLVLALIFFFAWSAVKVLVILEAVLEVRFRVDVPDNLQARKVHSQVSFLKRLGIACIVAVAIAAGLLTFDAVRQIGATLLASAGVAGLIIGLAAQRTLSLMLSGLQVAITQPIRLDDVLIVEGEWGRVEEIALTYVVLRIWDQRRLVVPVNYFLETPFQNWTRVGSELLGTVFLFVDYHCPLEPLREEVKRLCEAHEKWDGRVAMIQVTEAHERALELRVLVSAGDAPSLWDLRCAVREGLIDFVRREYPEHFALVRASLSESGKGSD